MTTNFVSQNPYQQPMMMQPYGMNPAVPAQKAATEVNAVKIELIEPKAYNGAPEASSQNGAYYNYPQASVYNPNGMPMMYPYPPMAQPNVPVSYPAPMPMMNPYIPQPYQAPIMQPEVQQMPPAPQPQIAPAQPEVQQPAMPQVPPAVVETPQAQPQTPAAAPTAPQQQTQVPQQPGHDINKLVQELGSEDLETQFNTINKVAELAQANTPDSKNLLSVDTFKGLASVINKDTAALEAPTQEQTALREKALGGKQLTPDEQAKAEQLAPQEIAEMNKQYALYTLAILQNSYRDAVNQELQTQGMEPAKINELPEINLIVDSIKSNPNALIREAGIKALSFIVRPEDKEIAKTIFSLAAQDSDPVVKDVANEALTKIGESAAAPTDATSEKDVKEPKKTRKERKAEKKAQKEAAKQEAEQAKQQDVKTEQAAQQPQPQNDKAA